MSNVLASVLYALGCFCYLAYLVNRSRVLIRVAYVIYFYLFLWHNFLGAVSGTKLYAYLCFLNLSLELTCNCCM